MKPKIAAQSGTFESSDVIFLIEPLPDNTVETGSKLLHHRRGDFQFPA